MAYSLRGDPQKKLCMRFRNFFCQLPCKCGHRCLSRWGDKTHQQRRLHWHHPVPTPVVADEYNISSTQFNFVVYHWMNVKKREKAGRTTNLVGNNAKDRFVSFQVININAFITAARHKLTAIMRELQCPQPKDIFTSNICAEVQTLMNILHPTPHQFPNKIMSCCCMHFGKYWNLRLKLRKRATMIQPYQNGNKT